MRRYRLATSQKGFTIVELLISSLVFSLVLLTVTIGVIQITRVYYKGITESTAQNAARDALDTISQAIQFNGGEVSKTNPSAPGNWATFCGGGRTRSATRKRSSSRAPRSRLAPRPISSESCRMPIFRIRLSRSATERQPSSTALASTCIAPYRTGRIARR